MDETAAKSERLLQIFFRLIRGDVLLKRNWRSSFMSQNEAFAGIWSL